MLSGYSAGLCPKNALPRLNPASRNALRQLTARRKQQRYEGRRQSEICRVYAPDVNVPAFRRVRRFAAVLD